MGSQHDWRLLSCSKRRDLDVPCIWRQGVGNIADDLSREALLAIWINNREGNGIAGMRDNGEIAVVPTIWSTMKSVLAVMLVRLDMGLHAINHEGTVLDAIRIATWYTSKMGMDFAFVVCCGIEAENNVALNTALVFHIQVGDGRAVWDEQSSNALGGDLILAVLVGALGSLGRSIVLRDRSRSEETQE